MAGFLRALVAFLANRPLLLTSSKVLAGTYALILLLHAKSLPFAYHVLATLYVAPTRLTLEYGKKRTLIKPQQSTSTSFRVGFDDLDLNLHMNNGVYPKQCDYARLIFMTSLFGLQVLPLNPKFSLNFISGGTQFIFLKEIRLGQKYTITTRLLSFSEKWFYVQHVFSTVHPKTGKKVINCLAVTRLIFKETRGKLRGKTVSCLDALQRAGHDISSLVDQEKKGVTTLENSWVVDGTVSPQPQNVFADKQAYAGVGKEFAQTSKQAETLLLELQDSF